MKAPTKAELATRLSDALERIAELELALDNAEEYGAEQENAAYGSTDLRRVHEALLGALDRAGIRRSQFHNFDTLVAALDDGRLEVCICA